MFPFPQLVLLLILLLASEYIVDGKSYISKPFFILLKCHFHCLLVLCSIYFCTEELSSPSAKSVFGFYSFNCRRAEVLQESLINLAGLLDKSVFLFFCFDRIGFLLKNYKNNYASVLGLFALLTLIFLCSQSPQHNLAVQSPL